MLNWGPPHTTQVGSAKHGYWTGMEKKRREEESGIRGDLIWRKQPTENGGVEDSTPNIDKQKSPRAGLNFLSCGQSIKKAISKMQNLYLNT